jgi:hypothetical protein
MPWYRRFRMLIGIYLIALAFGVREYVVSRNAAPVDMMSDAWARMTNVVEAINPDDPDTEYLASIRAMREGDAEEFMRRMERAVESGVKHNDILMQTYAQQLLAQLPVPARRHVDHPVPVHLPEPRHRQRRGSVEHQHRRRPRLEPRAPRHHHRPRHHPDRDVRLVRREFPRHARQEDRRRTRRARPRQRPVHVGRRPARRDPEHDVARAHSARVHLALARGAIVLGALDSFDQRAGSARDHALHLVRRRPERRRAFRRVEHRQPPARPRADRVEPSAAREPLRDELHRPDDLRARPRDARRHRRVLGVHHVEGLAGREEVEVRRTRIRLLGREALAPAHAFFSCRAKRVPGSHSRLPSIAPPSTTKHSPVT